MKALDLRDGLGVRESDGWKRTVVGFGLGIVFVFEFGEFVVLKVWAVVSPLFGK